MKKAISITFILSCLFVSFSFAQNNPYEKLKEAEKKMKANDLSGALAIVNILVEKYPNNVNVYSFRASIHSILGNFPSATADLSKAIEIMPKDSELYIRRASTRQMVADYQGTLEDYNKALENGAQGERIFSLRASIKQILNDTDGALKDYEMAVKITPHSVVANMGYARIIFREKDKQLGIKHLKDFLMQLEKDWNKEFPELKATSIGNDTFNSSPPKDWSQNKVFTGGKVIVSKNEPQSREEAEKQTRYMEQILNIPAAYATLASFYIEVDDIPNAEENIKKTFSLETRGAFHDIRAKIRYKKGDYNGAIDDINIALTRYAFPTLYLERGLSYFMLGKEKESQADFDKFLEMYPKGKKFLDKSLEEAKQLKEKLHK